MNHDFNNKKCALNSDWTTPNTRPICICPPKETRQVDESWKPAEHYELNYCKTCIQNTNHLEGICQKCKPAKHEVGECGAVAFALPDGKMCAECGKKLPEVSQSPKWENEFRSLWQSTRENEGKYEKVKSFIRKVIERAEFAEHERMYIEKVVEADKAFERGKRQRLES